MKVSQNSFSAEKPTAAAVARRPPHMYIIYKEEVFHIAKALPEISIDKEKNLCYTHIKSINKEAFV